MDGKHLMRFQSETPVFKFLRRSVEGPKGARLHTRGRNTWIHVTTYCLSSVQAMKSRVVHMK